MAGNRKKRHKQPPSGCQRAGPATPTELQPCDIKAQGDVQSGLPLKSHSPRAKARPPAVHRGLPQEATHSRLVRLSLFVLVAVIYSNSLQCGFVYDDQRAILTNRNVQLVEAHSRINSAQDLKEWLRRVFFVDDFWGNPMRNAGSHKSYRPLVTLSFRAELELQHRIKLLVAGAKPDAATAATSDGRQHESAGGGAGGSAFWAHLVNLILHLVVCDLVFQFASVHFPSLTGDSRVPVQDKSDKEARLHYHNDPDPHEASRKNSARRELAAAPKPEVQVGVDGDEKVTNSRGCYEFAAGRPNSIACLAAVLFACHPIHVEAVTSLVGRAELLASLFGLLSLQNMTEYMFQASTTAANHQLNRSRNFAPKWALSKSLVWAVLALLSKESATSVIAINILIAIWAFAMAAGALGPGSDDKRRELATKCTRAVVIMSLVLLAYAVHRIAISGSTLLPSFSSLDNPLNQDTRQFCLGVTAREDCENEWKLGQVARWLSLTRLYLPTFALGLLVYPRVLSYDWPLSSIGVITSPLEPRAVFALFLYGLVLMVIGRCCWAQLRLIARTSSQRRREANQASEHAGLDEPDDEASETSSVLSMDTLRSSDSGFAETRAPTPSSDCSKPSSSPDLLESDESDKENSPGASSNEELMSAAVTCPAGTRQQTSGGLKGRAAARASKSIRDSDLAGAQNHNRVIWSLVLLIVPYGPASNLFVSVGLLVAERTLYLPSVGFCLLAAHLLDHLSRGAASLWATLSRDDRSSRRFRIKQSKFLSTDRKRPAHPPVARLKIALGRLAPKSRTQSGGQTPGGGTPLGAPACATEARGGRWPAGAQTTLTLALVLPLVLAGSLRTYGRNFDWRDEVSLYSSNIDQSPAKSLANLASLQLMGRAGPNGSPAETLRLYQRALALEPGSADLRYNLALALHRLSSEFEPSPGTRPAQLSRWLREHQLAGLTGQLEGQPRGQAAGDPVEHHYRMALKLRGGNFPMAALSLAAWQSNELNQLVAAEESLIVGCAGGLAPPNKTKNHNQHVRTQIECLIRACRLALGDFAGADRRRAALLAPGQIGRQPVANARKQTAAASAEQRSTPKTTSDAVAQAAANGPQSSIAAGKCSKIAGWLGLAKEKVEQIDEGRTSRLVGADEFASAPAAAGPDQLGDLSKQLATIHWLESRCGLGGDAGGNPISRAHQFALASSSPVDWDIYLDYADSLGDARAQVAAIERAAAAEARKGGESVASNLAMAARRLAAGHGRPPEQALELTRRAINLERNNAAHLTLAGQLSYEAGRRAESETFYQRALAELARQAGRDSCVSEGAIETGSAPGRRQRLAAAHTNYGAILQVNGRPAELAREHYRRALDCDPNNLAAAQNLARIRAGGRAPRPETTP